MQFVIGMLLVTPISPFVEACLILSVFSIILSTVISRHLRNRKTGRNTITRIARGLSIISIFCGFVTLIARIVNTFRIVEHHDYDQLFILREVLAVPILLVVVATVAFLIAERAVRASLPQTSSRSELD